MTVKQLMEKLQTLPPDMRVFWPDHVEGNDCEAECVTVGPGNVYSPDKGKCTHSETVAFICATYDPLMGDKVV